MGIKRQEFTMQHVLSSQNNPDLNSLIQTFKPPFNWWLAF